MDEEKEKKLRKNILRLCFRGSLKLISAFSPFLLEFHLLAPSEAHSDAGIDFILRSISFNCHHIFSSFDSSRYSMQSPRNWKIKEVLMKKGGTAERTIERLIKDSAFSVNYLNWISMLCLIRV